jgi:methyl-accepting chemotaxis protein
MQEVVASIQRVTDIMAEITAASAEQSAGIEQVNQAVAQMDQVTQQNAALVEQAAAAAESMQTQAQQLAGAVAVFKLAGNASAAQVAPRAEASPKSWPQVERRGPNRAKNVTRLAAKASAPDASAKAKTGTDDDWTEF